MSLCPSLCVFCEMLQIIRLTGLIGKLKQSLFVSFRTKEDDVAKISTSVFIKNFPQSCSAKELFQSCKQYGHVVDTFIPTKRSKNGRRFGFVRFINVFNEERLVNNLCTVWIDRFKLHANIARFHRPPLKEKNVIPKKDGGGKNSNSFVFKEHSGFNGGAVSNEGFVDIKIQYMGELWVLLEFGSEDSMKLFQDNVSIGSWFSQLKQATMEFTNEGRIAWVEVEETPGWVPYFMEENDDEEQSDVDSKECEFKVHDTGIYGCDSDVEEARETLFEKSGKKENKDGHGNCVNKNSKEDVSSSVCSCHFKKSGVPRTGGSILNLMDELVKVGQVMGYKMDGCISNMTEIIESQGVKEVNFMTLQETKMENMELFSVKMCWGNFAFDYVYSDFVGNSRVSNREVVIIDDCNEVRYKSDRFGSMFNVQGANVFNSFIRNAGLEENEMEGFNKVVEDAWREGPCDKTNVMLNMMMKLKFLKVKIREWNKSNMLSVKNIKAKYKEGLEALEAIINRGDGNEEIVNKRTEVVNNIQKLDKIHSSEMAQKAKVKWSIEGDENTSFFHGVLNKKRSILNIRCIMVDGNWIESPKAVKGEFFQHFSSRFDKADVSRATINIRYPKTLTYDQHNELESEVSNVEIKREKIIQNDVYDAVKYFFTYGNIPKGCNSSFIALIPKILDANMVKDFRPISLIGSLYKIIAKILANRLVGVLGDIVNEVQSAFIAERQILDGPFILNEILQWSKTKKKQSLIFKVDFEKAYDSVRWDFLDDILKKFGFGEKWCKWIQSCLRSSRGSILINGSPTEEFQFYKGLKQGDPLSPFLFILIMESLHLSFQRVVDNGMFNGIKLSSSLSISHLFYADDAVFMGQWCDGNISTLIHVLECFYRASGLRINMSKSKILGVNVDSDKVKGAASKLGCLILKTPFTYLGSKVGGSMSQVHAWNEVIDRVKNWLSKWKMKTLSIVGRGGVEQDQFNELSALVHDVSLIPMSDRWKWDLESSRDFFIASVRKIIADNSLSDVDSKTRWKKYMSIKVNVHAWKVKTDSLPTRFNVSRRGLILIPLCVLFVIMWWRHLDTCSSIVAWLDKLFARSLIGGMFLMLRSNYTKIGIISL
ncbi:RNA-directed DNA polymerase, eukaryota [Tanacetum coccineum]